MVPGDQSMYNIDIVRVSSCILVPRTLRIFERHMHESYEVHYVIAGLGSFELGGRQLTVRPGEYDEPKWLKRLREGLERLRRRLRR